MHLLPWLTEDFVSPLPPAELLGRLRVSVEETREFAGTVGPFGFELSRVIAYRNSMLPHIEGWVGNDPAGGSRLRLRHRLPTFTLIFGVLWLTAVGGFAAMTLPWLMRAGAAGQWRDVFGPSLIPLGMFGFGLLLLTVPFWLEVRQSRPRLMEMLQLHPAPPRPPAGPTDRA